MRCRKATWWHDVLESCGGGEGGGNAEAWSRHSLLKQYVMQGCSHRTVFPSLLHIWCAVAGETLRFSSCLTRARQSQELPLNDRLFCYVSAVGQSCGLEKLGVKWEWVGISAGGVDTGQSTDLAGISCSWRQASTYRSRMKEQKVRFLEY